MGWHLIAVCNTSGIVRPAVVAHPGGMGSIGAGGITGGMAAAGAVATGGGVATGGDAGAGGVVAATGCTAPESAPGAAVSVAVAIASEMALSPGGARVPGGTIFCGVGFMAEAATVGDESRADGVSGFSFSGAGSCEAALSGGDADDGLPIAAPASAEPGLATGGTGPDRLPHGMAMHEAQDTTMQAPSRQGHLPAHRLGSPFRGGCLNRARRITGSLWEP